MLPPKIRERFFELLRMVLIIYIAVTLVNELGKSSLSDMPRGIFIAFWIVVLYILHYILHLIPLQLAKRRAALLLDFEGLLIGVIKTFIVMTSAYLVNYFLLKADVLYIVFSITPYMILFHYGERERREDMERWRRYQEREGKKAQEFERLSAKIELYNIEKIGREYKVLGMLEASGDNERDARLYLLQEAEKIGADAIINYKLAIDNNTSGDIVGVTLDGNGFTDGYVSTDTNYHMYGTAIKILPRKKEEQNFESIEPQEMRWH